MVLIAQILPSSFTLALGLLLIEGKKQQPQVSVDKTRHEDDGHHRPHERSLLPAVLCGAYCLALELTLRVVASRDGDPKLLLLCVATIRILLCAPWLFNAIPASSKQAFAVLFIYASTLLGTSVGTSGLTNGVSPALDSYAVKAIVQDAMTGAFIACVHAMVR